MIDFVNTADLERGTEELNTPTALTDWLQSRGLLDGQTLVPTAAQLAESIDLREALRAAMLAHNGGDPDPQSAQALEHAAERGQLSVRFGRDGSIGVGPRASGMQGVLAGLLAPVAEAAADGTWARVKACRADDCRWAFYDQSRNRSGRWCDMAVCGNRTKVRTYRTRRGDQG